MFPKASGICCKELDERSRSVRTLLTLITHGKIEEFKLFPPRSRYFRDIEEFRRRIDLGVT
jgi:hypothetical protein